MRRIASGLRAVSLILVVLMSSLLLTAVAEAQTCGNPNVGNYLLD
jgi:hypothetical protein